MKQLNLLSNSDDIKVGDNGTLIPFSAYDDGNRVTLNDDETATFNIKNNSGFVLSAKAKMSAGGILFNLDTKDIQALTPDTYYCELWITTNDDTATKIYPDKGFVQFTINENTLHIKGETLPEISLSEFEKRFKDYADSIKQGPVGPQGEQGKSASVSIGSVTTVDSSQSASVTNTGTSTDAIFDFNIPKGEKGDKGDRGEQGPVDTQAIAVANEAKTTADNATEQVTSSISDFNTQMSALKGSLSLVPNNLMLDASFNQTLSDNYTIIKDNNTTIEVITNGYNGDNSLKVSATSLTDVKYYGAQIKPDKFLPVNAGDHYSFSSMVKAYDLDASAKLEINFFDGNKSRINKTGITIDNPIGNNWTPVKLEDFVIPSGAVYMNVNFFVYKNGTIEVAHPQLVYGSVAPSSWLPSVSDLSKQISNLQSQINALKGRWY